MTVPGSHYAGAVLDLHWTVHGWVGGPVEWIEVGPVAQMRHQISVSAGPSATRYHWPSSHFHSVLYCVGIHCTRQTVGDGATSTSARKPGPRRRELC
jgi:hypothetical protein